MIMEYLVDGYLFHVSSIMCSPAYSAGNNKLIRLRVAALDIERISSLHQMKGMASLS